MIWLGPFTHLLSMINDVKLNSQLLAPDNESFASLHHENFIHTYSRGNKQATQNKKQFIMSGITLYRRVLQRRKCLRNMRMPPSLIISD